MECSFCEMQFHESRNRQNDSVLNIAYFQHNIHFFCSQVCTRIFDMDSTSFLLNITYSLIATWWLSITCWTDVNHWIAQQWHSYVIKSFWIWYFSVNVFPCILMRLYLITPYVKRKETHKSVKAGNSGHRTLSLPLLHKCSKIFSFQKRIFIYIEK